MKQELIEIEDEQRLEKIQEGFKTIGKIENKIEIEKDQGRSDLGESTDDDEDEDVSMRDVILID